MVNFCEADDSNIKCNFLFTCVYVLFANNSFSVVMGGSEDRKRGGGKEGKLYVFQWLSSLKLELDVTS